MILIRAGRHGERAVDRDDDVGHRNPIGRSRQDVAAADALVRDEQARSRELLQHFRKQFDGNVEALGKLSRAGRPVAGRQVAHRNEGVIRTFGKAQHKGRP